MIKPREFPSDYDRTIDIETSQKIKEAKDRNYGRIKSIEESRPKKPIENNHSSSGRCKGIILGYCIMCVFNLISATSFTKGNIEMTTIIVGIISWIATIIICTKIGKSKDANEMESYEEELDNIQLYIERENKSLKYEEERIEEEAKRKKQKYREEFEKEAQGLSVQYAESELAKEVIEWMTNGFSKQIDAADRRSHIEKVVIPFEINVYYNKITCNLGEFDFELKRCSNLNSPLEQTALGRAIASNIQLNIIMKYPKDVTGTDVSIGISYRYSSNCSHTAINYVAPNGKYKNVRGW